MIFFFQKSFFDFYWWVAQETTNTNRFVLAHRVQYHKCPVLVFAVGKLSDSKYKSLCACLQLLTWPAYTNIKYLCWWPVTMTLNIKKCDTSSPNSFQRDIWSFQFDSPSHHSMVPRCPLATLLIQCTLIIYAKVHLIFTVATTLRSRSTASLRPSPADAVLVWFCLVLQRLKLRAEAES